MNSLSPVSPVAQRARQSLSVDTDNMGSGPNSAQHSRRSSRNSPGMGKSLTRRSTRRSSRHSAARGISPTSPRLSPVSPTANTSGRSSSKREHTVGLANLVLAKSKFSGQGATADGRPSLVTRRPSIFPGGKGKKFTKLISSLGKKGAMANNAGKWGMLMRARTQLKLDVTREDLLRMSRIRDNFQVFHKCWKLVHYDVSMISVFYPLLF